jgi:hypothetical protein
VANITPPAEFRPHIHALVRADDDAIESLISALSTSGPALRARLLAKRLADHVQGFDKKSLRQVVDFLVATDKVWKSTKLTPGEFAEVLTASIKEGDSSLTDSDLVKFSVRIPRFLALEESLGITAKALDIFSENERVFCDARVVSDIRTIFAEDVSQPPHNAVIIHMLRLGYHEDGSHVDFYVALDSSDLVALKREIERAELKTETLKTLLGTSQIEYLDVE